jgi:hypothetical protein
MIDYIAMMQEYFGKRHEGSLTDSPFSIRHNACLTFFSFSQQVSGVNLLALGPPIMQ